MRFRDHCRREAERTEDLLDALLWTRLADEVDAYRAGDESVVGVPTEDDVPLFS